MKYYILKLNKKYENTLPNAVHSYQKGCFKEIY